MTNSEALFARYQELQRYVGWSDEDVDRVRSGLEIVRPSLPSLIDDFYEEIGRHQGARQVITGGDWPNVGGRRSRVTQSFERH